jgi:tetratricopeptide (TPR) repeat protein
MAEEEKNPAKGVASKQDASVHLDLDGSLKLSETSPDKSAHDRALLDSAIKNLYVAQQYIDESKHLVEHRLICFHYAISLLARYRSAYEKQILDLIGDHKGEPTHAQVARLNTEEKEKISLARHLLEDAANWRLRQDENTARLDDAYKRIVCEAQYNLGVIDEIEGRFQLAVDHYIRALNIVFERDSNATMAAERRGPIYSGVEVLARLGCISCSVRSLHQGRPIEIEDPDQTTGTGKNVKIQMNEREILDQIEALNGLIEAQDKDVGNSVPEPRAPAEVKRYSFGESVRRFFNPAAEDISVEDSRTTVRRDGKATGAIAPSYLPQNTLLTLISDRLRRYQKEVEDRTKDRPSQP